MRLVIFSLFMLFIPNFVLADNTGGSLFTPSSGDLSIGFLSSFFGVVDGILHGGGSQILGAMFGVFNAVILIFGAIMLAYVLIMGTINTANEGEMLGRKWSSVWVPIRLVISIVLLIPKASGYSLIQVLVMWVVVQGVGVADKVWDRVIDYIQQGGVIIAPESPKAVEGFSDIGYELYQAQICMFAVQDALNERLKKRIGKLQPPVNFAPSLVINESNNNYTLAIPGKVSGYEDYEGACGKVSWLKDSQTNVNHYNAVALWQMLMDTQGAANIIASNKKEILSRQFDIIQNVTSLPMINAARDYNAIYSTFVNKSNETQDYYNDAKRKGWLTAGAYFTNFIQVSNTSGKQTFQKPKFVESICSGNNNDNDIIKEAKSYVCQSPPVSLYLTWTLGEVSKFIAEHAGPNVKDKISPAGEKAIQGIQVALTGLRIIMPALSTINDFITVVINLLKATDALNILSNRTNHHPITGIITLGDILVTLGNTLVRVSASTSFTAALAGVVPAVNPIGFAVVSVAAMLTGLINGLGAILYINGVMMAYYLPVIPAIIFAFGVLGWLLGVFESILAAPIVALGIASPSANSELFGKAEPAVMLLLNIFLRPTLMLFGFIGGIILSAVGFWIFSTVFNLSSIIFGFLSHYQINIDWIMKLMVFLCAIFSIYCGCVVFIFQKSFSLIHVLPDKIMRWLSGGMQSQFGSEFSGIEGEAKQLGERGAQASHGSYQGGAGSGKGLGEHVSGQVNKDKADREKSIKADPQLNVSGHTNQNQNQS